MVILSWCLLAVCMLLTAGGVEEMQIGGAVTQEAAAQQGATSLAAVASPAYTDMQ